MTTSSVCVFPNFPHALDSVPDENWSVEHVLQWHLLKSHAQTDRKHDELVASLQQQLEEGKKELHQLLLHSSSPENSNNHAGAGGGIVDTTNATKSLLNTNKSANNNNNAPLKTIQITIIAGPHSSNSNNSYSLQPKSNAPCMVGRSAGKKFRDKGLSLSKDSEVSTTHGKFEIISNRAYFTDVGSTNGTTYHNVLLEPNEPFLLDEQMILVVGGSTIQITGLLS
eukprot:CAMPEP_0119005878 /NCGR_PEP_ID=MMETSP1176-20130426/1983_1 /TAXON_ID=265551 /ORGANISM="Synedropsis recta cf, Strain CCMP1620" /LENGTH=224 /DNA_ID=CAMNT_0006957733 /DNA_START=46 /DNA_END=720 /DNA_ORIENTATION=+